MKYQLPAAVLSAVVLATIMNMNAAMPNLGIVPSDLPKHNPQGAVPSDLPEHDPLDPKPHSPCCSIGNNSKGKKDWRAISASEWVVFFFAGLMLIGSLALVCHTICNQTCKDDTVNQAAFNRMLYRERHPRDYSYNRVARRQRNNAAARFTSPLQISSPIMGNTAPASVFHKDPFYRNVQDNLRAKLQEGEKNKLPRGIQVPGSRSQNRVPISSPCATRTSHD